MSSDNLLAVIDALHEFGAALLAEAEHHLASAEDAEQPTSKRARSLAQATASVNDAEQALRAAGIWPE